MGRPLQATPTIGEPLPIVVQPVIIADGYVEVGDIAVAVRKLRSGRAGGLSGMKAEHLKSWLQDATREKDPDTNTCKKLVIVIQVVFWEGYSPRH